MKVTIKIISLVAILLFSSGIDSTASDSIYGPYTVGFESYRTYDASRSYIVDKDTISRPLLIHFWYPSQEKKGGQSLNFKHYIDLIAQREDFNKSRSEIDNNSFYYVKGYSDYAKNNFGLDTSITVQQILESPVSAKSGLPLPLNDQELPLLIYAPSNGKVSVQNHLICEYLASHGFMILSVASAGPNSINRENMEESTIAQVMDMEYILNYAEDSLHILYSSLGLFGFSSGGNGIALFQMRNKKVNAVLSLDGSQEFGYYMKLYKMEEINLEKMDLPYLSMVNNYGNYSIYPYYNSIISTEKYIFRMPYLNHFGFVSNWHFFESCSSDPIYSNISISYEYISECTLGFFTKYLKSDPSLFDSKFFAHHDKEYIQPVTQNRTAITTLCNTMLDNNLDLASSLIEDHKSEFFTGENQLNLLARMMIDKDMSIWLYQKSIEYQPDSWETYYNLGYTYNDNGEAMLAKNALLKAKELDPENKKVANLLNELTSPE